MFRMTAFKLIGLMVIAAVYAVASPVPLSSQNKDTERKWSIDERLPDSQACGVVLGQDGYLWLATVRHLVRFDGFRFMTVAMPAQSTVGRAVPVTPRNCAHYQDFLLDLVSSY